MRAGGAALAGVSLLAMASVCEACAPQGEGFTILATPEAEIAYRWQPNPIMVGQFFEAEVVTCRTPGAEPVGEVVLDAQMPAHGHGMNYRPTVAPAGTGRYRISGLMLHMAGRWRFTFDLMQGERRTRLTQDLDLEP